MASSRMPVLVWLVFKKPSCHLWVTLGVREGTGQSHQVATHCWRLVLCPLPWGLVLWVGHSRLGAQGQDRSSHAVCRCGSPLVSEGPSEGKRRHIRYSRCQKCEGLCIFSSLLAISFLNLYTQPLTPGMFFLVHSTPRHQAPWSLFPGSLLQPHSRL